MLLFLFLLVAGQACAEGSGQVLQIKNSKGETFSYKDRVAQEKEVFDIKDRFAIILKYALTRVAEVGSLSSGAKMVRKISSNAYLQFSNECVVFAHNPKFANLAQ